MSKREAKKWLKAFKKAKFKCIAPQQVFEAMQLLQKDSIAQLDRA